jgi:hypothetical protein
MFLFWLNGVQERTGWKHIKIRLKAKGVRQKENDTEGWV